MQRLKHSYISFVKNGTSEDSGEQDNDEIAFNHKINRLSTLLNKVRNKKIYGEKSSVIICCEPVKNLELVSAYYDQTTKAV